MARAYGDHPDTWQYHWEVTAKNRYSKRLVFVHYYDNEKEARQDYRDLKGGDYIVKVRDTRATPRWAS